MVGVGVLGFGLGAGHLVKANEVDEDFTRFDRVVDVFMPYDALIQLF